MKDDVVCSGNVILMPLAMWGLLAPLFFATWIDIMRNRLAQNGTKKAGIYQKRNLHQNVKLMCFFPWDITPDGMNKPWKFRLNLTFRYACSLIETHPRILVSQQMGDRIKSMNEVAPES